MIESNKRQRAAAAAQSGEVQLRQYLETRDAHGLERAIELLQRGAEDLTDSDSGKVPCMLNLAGAYALRFQVGSERADFVTAISWNERVLAGNPNEASKVQALFNIGALLFEDYKVSGKLGVLETAIDSFTQSLQTCAPEHPLRKILVGSLPGMLFELTLKTPNEVETGERWQRAFYAVPFRSLDQKALQAAWRQAFGERAQARHSPPKPLSFLEKNRACLRVHAAANEAVAVITAGAPTAEPREVTSYAELQEAIENLRAASPDALLVFRGQTGFHDGRLAPSIARSVVQEDEKTNRLWVAAVSENLRYGEADPLTQMVWDLRAGAGILMAFEPDEDFWQESDTTALKAQAILQHYGARTDFMDVSRSLEVALWFSHFRFHTRREIAGLDELAARGAQWDADDAAPEYDIAWYEPAWSGPASAWGYLFVLAPRLPQSGDTPVPGEYIELADFPSPRMRAQHAGLVYIDWKRTDGGTNALAAFKFRLPLSGVAPELLNASVERLFPPPDEDPLYARILWSTPFWPDAERPAVQVRRLRIPEYHSAPAVRPGLESWGDWLPFRARDNYTRPGFVFSRLVRDASAGRCGVAGRKFHLSDALPLVPGFPSMMIEVPIPDPGARLDVLGRSEVFLEYDPLSRSLSPRAAAFHMTEQIDRRLGESNATFVPLPGVRGAWVIQAGELYWCRVYTQAEDGSLSSTAGRAFCFDHQFGWIVKEGPETVTVSDAVEMRAERAAFYLALGISEKIGRGTWHVAGSAGSPYFRLRMV